MFSFYVLGVMKNILKVGLRYVQLRNVIVKINYFVPESCDKKSHFYGIEDGTEVLVIML